MSNWALTISGHRMHKLILPLAAFAALAPGAIAQQPAPAPTPPAAVYRDEHNRVSETLIDASVPDDQTVDKMLAAYSPRVRALDTVVGKLKGELKKGGMGAGSLGNFVTDGMRAQASAKLGRPVDVAIINSGGLRRNAIVEGELRARDIFELLPFENALVTLDLTGDQLLRLLRTVVSSREAQSGARLVYITKADRTSELETAKLIDAQGREKEINPNASYTIVTIDYLVNVGGERYGVLREGKNTKALGVTVRDGIIDYIKSETAAAREIKPRLDERFILDRAHSAVSNETPPQ